MLTRAGAGRLPRDCPRQTKWSGIDPPPAHHRPGRRRRRDSASLADLHARGLTPAASPRVDGEPASGEAVEAGCAGPPTAACSSLVRLADRPGAAHAHPRAPQGTNWRRRPRSPTASHERPAACVLASTFPALCPDPAHRRPRPPRRRPAGRRPGGRPDRRPVRYRAAGGRQLACPGQLPSQELFRQAEDVLAGSPLRPSRCSAWRHLRRPAPTATRRGSPPRSARAAAHLRPRLRQRLRHHRLTHRPGAHGSRARVLMPPAPAAPAA
jgi:hypothetical protein